MSNQEDQPQQNSANVSVSNGDIMPSTPPPAEKKTNHNRNGNSINYKNKNNNSKNNTSNSEANQQHAHHQSQQNSHQQEVQNFPDISGEIASFSEKTFDELEAFSKAVGIKTHGKMNYQDLVLAIVKAQMEKKGFEFIIGVLEVMESGFGFLRQSQWNYAKSPGDVYVSPASIKQYNLKKGDTIAGFIKEPKNGDKADKFKALSKIVSVNYKCEFGQKKRVTFDSLVPIYPNERFNLETTSSSMLSTRILNMFSPIGKGQRSLIVAPPRTGKTILLQNIANAIVANHPEIYLIVLLIDERPEEVTDMQRSVRGEVISSTFDEEPDKHCHVAEIVLEKAKRLTEEGLDIVILLDSITRLARAYNQNIPASGKVLSGGVDAKALIGPKKFFGAARNIEHGGSLTIIGTSLIETGSRMDEVIFEEFKGTGNMEVNLDRSMSERRIYPAIDIFKSGTRKEELLLPASELEISWAIREQLSSRKAESGEIMRLMIEKLKEFKTNKAFLSSYKFSGTKNI